MELKDKIIKKVIKDKSYADYLIGENLSDGCMIDLICHAPVSLFQKAKWLSGLAETQVLTPQEKFYEFSSYEYYLDILNAAIEELTVENTCSRGEVFILVGYCLENGESNQFECMAFNSFSRVTEYLREAFAETDECSDNDCWHVLEKWVPINNGDTMEESYTYTCIGSEVCYFTNYLWLEEKVTHDNRVLHKCRSIFSLGDSGLNCNLPTPFKPGDMLEIDGRPFAPKTTVTVADNINPYDCCSPFCEYIGKDGKKEQGALKHSHIYKEYIFNCVSPLYTLKLKNKAKNEKS